MFPCLAWNQQNQHMQSFDFCIKQEKQSVKKQKTVSLSEKALVFMVTGYHSNTTPALTISEIIHRISLDGITSVLTLFVETVEDSRLQTEFLHLFQQGYTLQAQK